MPYKEQFLELCAEFSNFNICDFSTRPKCNKIIKINNGRNVLIVIPNNYCGNKHKAINVVSGLSLCAVKLFVISGSWHGQLGTISKCQVAANLRNSGHYKTINLDVMMFSNSIFNSVEKVAVTISCGHNRPKMTL